MSFKESYTTAAIKDKISKDLSATKEEKDKENLKTVVSDEAYLNAECLENIRRSLLNG